MSVSMRQCSMLNIDNLYWIFFWNYSLYNSTDHLLINKWNSIVKMHPCDMRDWMKHKKKMYETLIKQKSEVFMLLNALLIFSLIFVLGFNSFYKNPISNSIDTQNDEIYFWPISIHSFHSTFINEHFRLIPDVPKYFHINWNSADSR